MSGVLLTLFNLHFNDWSSSRALRFFQHYSCNILMTQVLTTLWKQLAVNYFQFSMIQLIDYVNSNTLKWYQCEQCWISLSDKTDVWRHQNVHARQTLYHCEELCGLNSSGAKSQEISLRTRQKPYYCEQCGKNVCEKTDSWRHQCVHTGEAVPLWMVWIVLVAMVVVVTMVVLSWWCWFLW